MNELLDKLLEENFDINFGRHHNCVGYYATMCKSYDSCEHVADDWDFAGHGHTLECALLEAEAIAKGQQDQTKRKPDSFRSTVDDIEYDILTDHCEVDLDYPMDTSWQEH